MLIQFFQILHDHKDEILVLTSLFAVMVSFITAFLAPIAQMRIARLTVQSNTLFSTRVKWIEAIQSDIATLVTLVERTTFLDKTLKQLHATMPKTKEAQDEFNRMHRELEEKTFQRNALSTLIGIKLDIFPEKKRKLFLAVNSISLRTPGMSTEHSKTEGVLKEIQDVTQDIVKEEWNWLERQVGHRSGPRRIAN